MLWLGVLSGGCAAQALRFDHRPLPLDAPRVSGPVEVEVRDSRRALKEGKIDPCQVGNYYSELGETAPMLLGGEDCESLADALRRDLTEELRQLGFSIGRGGKRLRVTIRDWEFEGYYSGMLWYDVQVVALDAGGAELASTHVRHSETLPDGHTRQSRETALARLPKLYDALVDGLLRHNDLVMEALTGS